MAAGWRAGEFVLVILEQEAAGIGHTVGGVNFTRLQSQCHGVTVADDANDDVVAQFDLPGFLAHQLMVFCQPVFDFHFFGVFEHGLAHAITRGCPAAVFAVRVEAELATFHVESGVTKNELLELAAGLCRLLGRRWFIACF